MNFTNFLKFVDHSFNAILKLNMSRMRIQWSNMESHKLTVNPNKGSNKMNSKTTSEDIIVIVKAFYVTTGPRSSENDQCGTMQSYATRHQTTHSKIKSKE